MFPEESPTRGLMGQWERYWVLLFGAGNNSLSALLVHLLCARLRARASMGALVKSSKPEAGRLTIPLLQIRNMWLRPKADCKHWLSQFSSPS